MWLSHNIKPVAAGYPSRTNREWQTRSLTGAALTLLGKTLKQGCGTQAATCESRYAGREPTINCVKLSPEGVNQVSLMSSHQSHLDITLQPTSNTQKAQRLAEVAEFPNADAQDISSWLLQAFKPFPAANHSETPNTLRAKGDAIFGSRG
ncbi:hypothetical protein JMJ76_0003225 [Colletotrichum scovillei]|nr:hypothetical protein JMJ76_0003225 [Colletotrichum scovillei]